MHKIQEKEFTLEDFSTEHLRPHSIKRLVDTVKSLNYYRDIYLNGDTDDNLGGDVATVFEPKDKDIWWQMIQLLPSSYNQTRNAMLNYEFWRTFISLVKIISWMNGVNSVSGLRNYLILN